MWSRKTIVLHYCFFCESLASPAHRVIVAQDGVSNLSLTRSSILLIELTRLCVDFQVYLKASSDIKTKQLKSSGTLIFP